MFETNRALILTILTNMLKRVRFDLRSMDGDPCSATPRPRDLALGPDRGT